MFDAMFLNYHPQAVAASPAWSQISVVEESVQILDLNSQTFFIHGSLVTLKNKPTTQVSQPSEVFWSVLYI